LRLTITVSLKAGELRSSLPCAFRRRKGFKESRGDSINHVKHNKKKNFSNSPQSKKNYSHVSKASSKGQGKALMREQDHVPKHVYIHYKKEGHYMRDCVEFLKWLNMRGKNSVRI
jgi:hypothetical protein